jgi:hypothetical protein
LILATRVSIGLNAGKSRKEHPVLIRVVMRVDRAPKGAGEPLVCGDIECGEGILDDREHVLRVFRDKAAQLQTLIESTCGPAAEVYHPDHQVEMQEATDREIVPINEGGKVCADDIPDRGPAELGCDIVIPGNVDHDEVGSLPLDNPDDAQLLH